MARPGTPAARSLRWASAAAPAAPGCWRLQENSPLPSVRPSVRPRAAGRSWASGRWEVFRVQRSLKKKTWVVSVTHGEYRAIICFPLGLTLF